MTRYVFEEVDPDSDYRRPLPDVGSCTSESDAAAWRDRLSAALHTHVEYVPTKMPDPYAMQVAYQLAGGE